MPREEVFLVTKATSVALGMAETQRLDAAVAGTERFGFRADFKRKAVAGKGKRGVSVGGLAAGFCWKVSFLVVFVERSPFCSFGGLAEKRCPCVWFGWKKVSFLLVSAPFWWFSWNGVL